ncbi:helix-turn-helix domain-containing protein [Sphingobacterium multivorum]|uniref:helix-turn-helix domain-containing protein n=1 Tax=Sphingobacterium multivorum TaxID=28454 RepID=UPI0028B14B24|nr:helix-turn-helix transcriptional regulator [Sphingobacterium multivorum]
MKKFSATITRDNIFILVRYSGLTLEEFGNIMGLSKRWIQYLKEGKYDFDIPSIEKASSFFNVPFTKLTTTIVKPSFGYRKMLESYHKNNIEYSKILSEPPSIPYLIEFILMRDPDFTTRTEMEIKDIRKIISKYDLTYKGSSLSTELQKSDFVEFWPHPTKNRTNLYKARI